MFWNQCLCCHWEEWAPVPKRGVTLCPAQPNGASEHQCPSSSTKPSPAHALSKVLHVTLWLPHNYVYKRDENTDNTYLLCIFFSVFTANSTPADLLQTNNHSTSAPDWCESFVTRRSFCFFFFCFGRERVWSAATFSARFWPLWIFNLYGRALNTSQGTALIFHLALTWPPIHLCWCWKNRLFLETAASFQTATPSCWHKRPTGVSPPAHHYSPVQIIYRLPPVTQ